MSHTVPTSELNLDTFAPVFRVPYCELFGVHIWLLKVFSSPTIKLIFQKLQSFATIESL